MSKDLVEHLPKEKVNVIHKMLWEHGYKQIKILTEFVNKEKVYTAIEVHANKLALDVHVDFIKDLLAGMGFKITGDTNSETITIQ